MKEIINSTLCYIEKDGMVLMLHRIKKKNDLNEGKWIGVGGKFEPGENAEECVVREVREETGVTLTEFHLCGVIKFRSAAWMDQDMYLFKGTDFTGEVNFDCSEGVLKWVPKEEVLSLPTWEGDHLFLEPFLAGREDLNMTVCYDENDCLVSFTDDTEKVTVQKAGNIRAKHGFSTRMGGVSEGIFQSLNLGMNRGDSKELVRENWRRFLRACDILQDSFVCGAQVAGTHVHIATKENLRPAFGSGEMVTADGYVTNQKDVPLVIFTADCIPVLLEDASNGVIGALHCGWRSTVGDIEKEGIEKMCALGAKPATIHAAIGPGIDMCCFEVGKEVVEAINVLLDDENLARKFYKEKGETPEKYMVDLKGVVAKRLEMLGLKPENIEFVGECTMCHPQKYWSHRFTKGERGSQANIISL